MKKAGRFYRRPHKYYQQCVRQAEWQYQQNLVKREDAKIQQEQERMIKNAEQVRLREEQPKEQIVGHNFYSRHQKYDERDEM